MQEQSGDYTVCMHQHDCHHRWPSMLHKLVSLMEPRPKMFMGGKCDAYLHALYKDLQEVWMGCQVILRIWTLEQVSGASQGHHPHLQTPCWLVADVQ